MGNLVKVPTCTCKGCTCGVAEKIIAMYKADKAYQFLMGLNDEAYSTIRSQILALDPLSTLDRIFNMTQQEDSHKKLMITRDTQTESSMAFTMREQTHVYEKGTCKICGRYGHEESVCYEVIGYLPR